MNEKHSGHLGLREINRLLERVQIPMSLRNATAAFIGLLSSRNPQWRTAEWQTRETFPNLQFGKSEMFFYSNSSSCKTLASNSIFSFPPCFNGLWIWDETGSIGQREKPYFQRTLFQGSLHSSSHTKSAPHSDHAKILAIIIWMTIWFLLLKHLCLMWDQRHPLNGMNICI